MEEEKKKHEALNKAANVDEGWGCNPLGNSGDGYSWAPLGKSLVNYLIKIKHEEENAMGSCLPSWKDWSKALLCNCSNELTSIGEAIC